MRTLSFICFNFIHVGVVMKNVVIIGSGPAGLYAANKLKKAGVREVTIYDPRAGTYTRPGHLNPSAFRQAERGLDTRLWSSETPGHIKDLERILHAEALRRHIIIEKKRFLRMHQDHAGHGIVVVNEDTGVEEIISADYVFDCTGVKREVVCAVNRLVAEPPFKLTTITELPVLNHMLAYVKMDLSDWLWLDDRTDLRGTVQSSLSLSAMTEGILKLRALGWNELKLPRCYGHSFGKNKVCLYLHAPEGLKRENYDAWLKTVIEIYAGRPIGYTHLTPSRKPRFLTFKSEAKALEKVAYKSHDLPTVIALGDAQIDFDYAKAHGILDGIKRIDALVEHIEILDGKIVYFDSDEYQMILAELLKIHKEALIGC
jgi:hypothetical protein